MNIEEFMKLLRVLYRRSHGFVSHLNQEYGLEWLIVLVGAIAVILFLWREKPLTNFIVWLSKVLVRFFKRFWNWLKEIFKKLKIKPVSPKIKKIADDLDDLAAGSFGRYNRPHYLLISYGSDVKSVMEGANDHDADTLILEDSNSNKETDKHWYLFNKGCVFDFPDPVQISDELQQLRPERPLDGIILSLSVNYLLDKSDLELQKQAEKIYKQLWQLQARFHFVLPVYILITDCEKIKGFKEFWSSELLTKHRDEIFGWSNPHEKFKPFNNLWIVNAMAGICNYLRQIQLNFITDHKSKDCLEKMLFPSHFSKLEKSISLFCKTIFGDSSFHEAFMFRGFYFTGRVIEDEKEETNDYKKSHLFLRDVFYKRIFAEANLAFAPQQKIFSSDKRLRLYQYLFLGIFTVLSVWLYHQQSELSHHAKNLEEKVETLPHHSILDDESSKDALVYVNSVLNHVANMDASNLVYSSIPWSYASDLDDKLTEYFAKRIFAKIIFPKLECRASNRINQILSTEPADEEYADWFEDLARVYVLNKELHELMLTKTKFTNKQIEQRFSHLVEKLFNQKLPKSFYERSDTYMNAIRQFEFEPGTGDCYVDKLTRDKTWRQIKIKADEFKELLPLTVAAPKEFFTLVPKLANLPPDNEWYQSQNAFADDLTEYLNWSRNLNQHWLQNHPENNSCERVKTSLQSLVNDEPRVIKEENYTNRFYNECIAAAHMKFVKDAPLLEPVLYENRVDNEFSFSEEAQRLLASMRQISELSFIETNVPRPDLLSDKETDFFWSIERLNRALRMYEEYKVFALAHYLQVQLPQKDKENRYHYAAQAVVLKQLQLAMLNTIASARIKENEDHFPDKYRPVNQQEAKLASYVQNFTRASEPLLKIHSIFTDLGFSKSNKILRDITNNHAYGLLKKANQLYTDSRIYQSSSEINWGAHFYTNALFGITNEGQLQDYLAAQSERIEYVAFNYVEPILIFLRATEARAVNYQLFGVWNNTLIELNKKKQNNDTSTTQSILEDFFTNTLLMMNQSDCFNQGKKIIEPKSNDHFANSQREIIEDARRHCSSYTADQIQKEYQEVFELFKSKFANKYPFSNSPLALNVSVADVKTFVKTYPGKSSGLAKRMDTLVYTQRDQDNKQTYIDARTFVKNLDLALAFFNSVIVASSQGDNSGIELSFEFDVLRDSAEYVDHIIQWQFVSGQSYVIYPTQEATSIQSILWSPNQDVSLHLNWAENSPYNARALNGKNQGRQLVYSGAGVWSLLRFIDRYRSGIPDTQKLIEDSILLNFSAELTNNQTVNDGSATNALALARVTLYGQDVETKEQLTIKLPKRFPKSAPKL